MCCIRAISAKYCKSLFNLILNKQLLEKIKWLKSGWQVGLQVGSLVEGRFNHGNQVEGRFNHGNQVEGRFNHGNKVKVVFNLFIGALCWVFLVLAGVNV